MFAGNEKVTSEHLEVGFKEALEAKGLLEEFLGLVNSDHNIYYAEGKTVDMMLEECGRDCISESFYITDREVLKKYIDNLEISTDSFLISRIKDLVG